MMIAGAAILIGLSPVATISPDTRGPEKAITRLPPSAFAQLPSRVRTYLERRGCTVPQSAYGKGRHNVIKGRYMVDNRMDWAVLCSRNGSSTILVFSRGRAAPVAEIGSSPDKEWLQGGIGGKPDFSHSIGTATKREVLSYQSAFGGWLPLRLHLDGIKDSFDGKTSVVLYWYRGKWVELQGTD